MSTINTVELDQLSKFRKRFGEGELNEEQSMDVFLIRWIRARDHNLDKAEEMLRMYLKRRKENGLENISDWEPPKEFKSLIFLGIIGDDRDNCPVIIQRFGRNKLQKIVKTGQQETFIKYIDLIWEQLHAQMKGKIQSDGLTPVTQFVGIADMKGFSYKSMANKGVIDLLLQFSRAFEANQPETLKKLYFINAGRVFPVLYSLIKPILAQSTKSKIAIYGSPSKWQPILLQNLPPAILPPAYGGTNTTSILENAAEAESDDWDERQLEFLTVTLPPAGQFSVAFQVAEKNGSIHWAVKTEKKEIGLRVLSGPQMYTYMTKVVDCHTKVVEDVVKCDAKGDFTLTFDNGANDEGQELKYKVDIRTASGAKQLDFD